MSKFCIELKNADLADIVDQLCVAWYEANSKAQIEITANWAEKLRNQIKAKHGKGWGLDGVGESQFNPHGKCRLQYKKTNHQRVGIVLPIHWRPENFHELFLMADAVITVFLANDLSLKEAFKTVIDRAANPAADWYDAQNVDLSNDLMPMADLAGRWGITANTVSRRLRFLGIKPIRHGNYRFITAEQLALGDELQQHVLSGKPMELLALERRYAAATG